MLSEKLELKNLVRYYTPVQLGQYSRAKDNVKICGPINSIITTGVEDLHQVLCDKISAINRINTQLLALLSYTNTVSTAQGMRYLREHEYELTTLKETSDKLTSELYGYKIKLLNEDESIVEELRNSFNAVKASEKHIDDTISIHGLIPAMPKVDINMFSYSVKPIILQMEYYYFLLFSKVIIVLNKHSGFVTALQPSALKITIELKTKEVAVSIDSKRAADAIIGTDSKKVTEGIPSYRWSYQHNIRRSDRRYTNNLAEDYHMETYEYGVVTYAIAGYTVKSMISSEVALSMLKVATENYCVSYDNVIDIPATLLSLLTRVSDSPTDKDNIYDLQAMYKKVHPQENYFYEIITEKTVSVLF